MLPSSKSQSFLEKIEEERAIEDDSIKLAEERLDGEDVSPN